MEALAGVALVGNILQFLQLSLNIVSKGKAYKRAADGNLKQHKDLQVVIADLNESLCQLEIENDDGLKELVRRCKEAGNELKDTLEEVAAKSTKGELFSSYWHALRVQWHEKKIEEQRGCFEVLRNETAVHIQMLMRRDISASLRSSQQTEQLAAKHDSNLTSLAAKQEESTERLVQCINSSRDAIFARCSGPLAVGELVAEFQDLCSLCRRLLSSLPTPDALAHESKAYTCTQEDFLKTFTFREMDDRETSIPRAHAKTYEWIFEVPGAQLDHSSSKRREAKQEVEATLAEMGVGLNRRKELLKHEDVIEHPTAPLQEWFIAGKGIFWIWGKPGCGKSTMMKAMLRNKRMRQRLEKLLQSRGGKDVLICLFYFFRPGLSLQKTQLGLLLSILHQILSQTPSAIDKLFSPVEKSQAFLRWKDQTVSNSVWSIRQLRRALKEWRDVDKTSLYLHVDGIDESECKPSELAHLLEKLTKLANVKVLAAGRYHPDFDAVFDPQQKLNMHELTETDILRYVVDNINQPKLEKLLNPAEKSAQIFSLVHEVVTAAKGVFQWVKIVIESLICGVHRFEDFNELFHRLKEYPKDLDDLYRFLYDNIETRYARRAAFWLATIYYASSSHSWSSFTFQTPHMVEAEAYDFRDMQWFEKNEPTSYLNKFMKNASLLIQHRMQTQALHFFDFGKRGKYVKEITFAHRTIFDFLGKDNEAMLKRLLLHLGPEKSPALSVLATLVLVKIGRNLSSAERRLLLPELLKILKQGFADRVFSFWSQLKTYIEREVRDKRFGVLDLENPARVPTFEGWAEETYFETIKRSGNYKGRLLHLAALRMGQGDAKLSLKLMSGMAVNMECDEEEKGLFVAECIVALRNTVDPSTAEKALSSFIRTLFPQGIRNPSIGLERVLELLRDDCFRKDSVGAPAFGLIIIRLFIEQGANPDTICKCTYHDENKAHLSIQALLTHMLDPSPCFLHDEHSEISREAFYELQECLNKKGARSIVVPCEDHEGPTQHGLHLVDQYSTSCEPNHLRTL